RLHASFGPPGVNRTRRSITPFHRLGPCCRRTRPSSQESRATSFMPTAQLSRLSQPLDLAGAIAILPPGPSRESSARVPSLDLGRYDSETSISHTGLYGRPATR
ncbi:MAG: hypothetical protein VST66_06365, partial [Nitrospirota bacterium]|nr:hypothetical protein [Nitrospirota bacterium]